MKKLFNVWMLFSIFLVSQNLFGVPATKRTVEMKQPDGTTLMVQIHGDEHLSWITTTDEYSIARNLEGNLEYIARIDGDTLPVLSGIRVSKPDLRTNEETTFLLTIEKQLRVKPRITPKARMSRSFSVGASGENWLMQKTQNGFSKRKKLKTIVVPVHFADYQLTYTQAEIDSALNGTNYTGHGFQGSVRDYYHDMSGGQFTYEALVLPPYTANGNRSGDYAWPAVGYGSGSKYGLDLMVEVVHYVNAILRERALTEFDGNGDGYIDHISVIFAGQGQELTGDDGMIWSNCSWRDVYDYARPANNIIFTMISEIDNFSNMLGIATYCHEFGHALGLPDLYDSDGQTNGLSEHPGNHDIMASNTGTGHPVPLSAFSRFTLGWYNLKEIGTAASISLPDMDTQHQALRINTTTVGEFFVLENRRNSKWNVPNIYEGHGMLIFRVDSAHYCSNLSTNKINAYANHLGYDVIRADNNANNSTNTDFFPTGAVSFTDQTTPSMKSLANANTNKPITNIAENSGVISFSLMGGGNNLLVSTHNVERAGNGKARVNAEILITGNETCTEKGVCYGLLPTPTISGSKVISDATGNTFETEISGLTVGATYYFRAYAKKVNGTAVYGSTKSMTVEEVVKVITEYGTTIVGKNNGAKVTIPIFDISEMQNPVLEFYTAYSSHYKIAGSGELLIYPGLKELSKKPEPIEGLHRNNEDYNYKIVFELPDKSDYYKLVLPFDYWDYMKKDSIVIRERTTINYLSLPYCEKYFDKSTNESWGNLSIVHLNTQTATKPMLYFKKQYDNNYDDIIIKYKTENGEYKTLEIIDNNDIPYNKITTGSCDFIYMQYQNQQSGYYYDEETETYLPQWEAVRNLEKRLISGDYFVELPQAADLTLYITGISEVHAFDYTGVPVLETLTVVTNTTAEVRIIVPEVEVDTEIGVCWYQGSTPNITNKIVLNKLGSFAVAFTNLPLANVTFNTYKNTGGVTSYGTPIVSQLIAGNRENKLERDSLKPIETIDFQNGVVTFRVWYDMALFTGVQAQGICWGTNENVVFSTNSLYEEGTPQEVLYFTVSKALLTYNSYDLYEYIRPFMIVGSNFIYDKDIYINEFCWDKNNVILDKTVSLPYDFINSNTDEEKYWKGNASIWMNYYHNWHHDNLYFYTTDRNYLPDTVFIQSPIINQAGANNPQVLFTVPEESYEYNHLPVTLYALNVITGEKQTITTFIPSRNYGNTFTLSTRNYGDSIRLRFEMPLIGSVIFSNLEIIDNPNYVVNAPTLEKTSETQLVFTGSYEANSTLPQVVETGFVWSTYGDPLDADGDLVGQRIIGQQSNTDITAGIAFEEVANVFARTYVKDNEGLYSYSEIASEFFCGTHTIAADYLPVTDNMTAPIYKMGGDGSVYLDSYNMVNCLYEEMTDGYIFYSGNLNITNRPSVNKITATVGLRVLVYMDMPDYSVYAEHFTCEYRTIGSSEWKTLPEAYHNVYFDKKIYPGIGAIHYYVNCIGELELPRNVEQIRVKAFESWASTYFYNSEKTGIMNITYTESTIPDIGCIEPDLHALTVDNQQVKIIFSVSDLTNVASLRIMRESQTAGVYDKIAELDVNNFKADEECRITDLAANPASRAYKYYVATVNAEGTEFASTPHKSAHLSINKGILNQWNLHWTFYEGLNVRTVRIYRGTSPDNMSYLDEVPGTNNTYTDISAPAGTLYYVVELVFNQTSALGAKKKRAVTSSRTNIVINNDVSLSSNANLSTLAVSSGTLTPVFNANTLHYTVAVENAISSINITATTEDSKANISGIGTFLLNVGNNSFNIVVTAEDGLTKKTYSVTVNRADKVGITEVENFAVNIYPNPTSGKLIIESGELKIETIEIHDINGRKLSTFTPQYSTIDLDISHLANGIYLVKIKTLDGETFTKIVKE